MKKLRIQNFTWMRLLNHLILAFWPMAVMIGLNLQVIGMPYGYFCVIYQKRSVLQLSVTSGSGLAGCGLIFHAEDNLGVGRQYRFYSYRLSGLPYWIVELWENGGYVNSAMGRGKLNSAINQENGSTNTFTLHVKEGVMTIYANNMRLSHVPISGTNQGRIAFFVFQESGETTCAYENAWLWELE